MKSKDIKNNLKTREEYRVLMQKAVRENDAEGFAEAWDGMCQAVGAEIRDEYDQQIQQLQADMDSRVLAARGVRQLTTEERNYCSKVLQAMRSADPKQALNSLDVVLPKTTIDSVFEDLRTKHPLLSQIDFIPSAGVVEMIMNKNGYQEAVWGDLTDKIVQEVTAGFQKVITNLLKLSAFMLVCKSMLDVGPEWLDRYIRECLYEALANGMEAGIVSGDGNKKPIGMNRQVGDGVTVTGGVYPVKDAIKIYDLSVDTVGNLLGMLSVDPEGKGRVLQNVIMVVNPQDYYLKVMPATTLRAPDGTYRRDVLPYPITILESPSVEPCKARFGLGKRYFAAAGTSKEGKIEYSDHYRFLEDERAYIIKAYANGMPKDNNAFLVLDISELRPAAFKVEVTNAPAASDNASLLDLRIGNLDLNPEFSADTDAYAVSTENATNTVAAIPADAGAEIAITVNDVAINNGTAAKWNDGANTVKAVVTAADGTTTKTYTVTVTKS